MKHVAPAAISAVRDETTDSVGAPIIAMAEGFGMSVPEPICREVLYNHNVFHVGA